MKFNRYIWDLYCANDFIKERIKGIQELTPALWAERFNRLLDSKERDAPDPCDYPLLNGPNYPICLSIVEDVAEAAQLKGPVDSPPAASDLYCRLLDQGVECRVFDDRESVIATETLINGDAWLSQIHSISLGLFLTYPEFFCPYGFVWQFHRFRRICDEFDIPLAPGVPARAKHRERALFYLDINQSLQEFRQRHRLTPAELCVFLEFAYEKILSDESETLPEPMKAWFMMGGAGTQVDFETLDNANEDAVRFWQGSIDTSLGDICLMWCASPRSYLHSIWRAASDGFAEPFFWGYGAAWMRNPIKVPHVTYAELKADPVLGMNPSVRANLQGSSGKPFTVDEYEALVGILARKGFDVSLLPRIPQRVVSLPNDLTNERDVELKLVEPLLSDLGYTEKHWHRQLPIRMGRGAPYYPDYAFNVRAPKRGEESAQMVLEAKYRLASHAQLEDAYLQAKSYALRLQAKIIVLAAIDGLWIFVSGKTGFTLKPTIEKTWAELASPDVFHQMKLLIGPEALHR